MAYKVHYSQRTPHERQAAREARTQSAGTPNRQGGVSFFRQGHGATEPTPEDVASSVQWQRGIEADTDTHTFSFGPRFDKVLPDVPVNAESASALSVQGSNRRG
jgi:hypothetical protein